MDAARPNLDVLLAEAGWVRALAHSLVRDPAAADDVVQETWLAALRRPPDTTRPVRPWLARVVENFARMRKRGEMGRERREERVARAESLTSTEDLCARVETQRLLAQEVLALGEPFRSTIVLRYYEGLSAAEIARRVGAPSATVRWRLMRGLEHLRERLDSRHDGNREAWSVLLAPLAATASKTALKSAAGFGLVAARLAMLLVLLLGLAWVWRGASRREDAFATGVRPSAALVDGPKQAGNEPVSGTTVRAVIPSRDQPGTGTRESCGRVIARIVDDELRPLAGAQLVLRSLALSAIAGSDGAVELLVPRERRELLTFEARAVGCVAADVQARIARDGDTYLGNLVAPRAGAIEGFVGDDLGRPIEGARVRAEVIGSRWKGVSTPPLEEARYVESLQSDAPLATSGPDGRYRFDALPRSFVRLWASADGYTTAWSADLSIAVGRTTRGAHFNLAQPPPEHRLAGVVLDPGGAPVAHAEIECARPSLQNAFFRGERGVIRARADEHGRFDFGVDPQSHYDLAARDTTDSFAPGMVAALAPGRRDIVVALTRVRTIAISAHDEVGAPIADSRVEFIAVASGKTLQLESEGLRAEVRAMPYVAFGVRVCAPSFAAAELGPFEPQSAPAQLDIVLKRASQFTGTVAASGGTPIAGARVELLVMSQSKRSRVAPDSVASGEPFTLSCDQPARRAATTTDAEGRFALDVSQAGNYMARIDAPGLATELVGPLELDDHSAIDRSIELTAGGTLEGRALRRDGEDVAGAIIGISCGDGWLATARVGPDGAFRFEHLAPRAWQVRSVPHETASDGFELLASGKRSLASSPPTWDVEVRDGAIAHCDVFVDVQACVLRGRLLFDGAAAGAWQARLMSSRGSKPAPAECVLEPDGRFELRVAQPGAYVLHLSRITRTEPALEITASVQLADGIDDWALDLATATLRVRLDTTRPSRNDLHVFATTTSGAEWRARGVARVDASGVTEFERWPAGSASVELDADGEPALVDPAHAEFELRAGETREIVLKQP